MTSANPYAVVECVPCCEGQEVRPERASVQNWPPKNLAPSQAVVQPFSRCNNRLMQILNKFFNITKYYEILCNFEVSYNIIVCLLLAVS